MPSQDEIFAKVSATLVEALNVDEEEIKPTSTLQGDLGAESIDFLDIVFRLEREFGIKIPRGELFAEPVFQGDADIVQDGQVTDEGLAALRTHMPYADLRDLERDRRLNRIDDLFTVALLSSYITWKLSGSGKTDRDHHATVPVSPSPIHQMSAESRGAQDYSSSSRCRGTWSDKPDS